MAYSFTRYLEAKAPIDDRSLNAHVRQTLLRALPERPFDVLEVGAGTGTMIARLASQGVLAGARSYTAVDADAVSMAQAEQRLAGLSLPLPIHLETADVFDFAARESGRRQWDLLIAHAFLDLVDLSRALPALFALLKPGGLFYFTLNFDGLTSLEPVLDPSFDEHVVTLYHRTMDERHVAGRPSGDSRTGRRLLTAIPRHGHLILAAGSSDWVVVPGVDGYAGDEAYFLHHILHFFEESLGDHPALDKQRFVAWLAARHAQIDAAELSFIAHQIDVCGRRA